MFKYKACNRASSINLSFNFVPCDIFVVNLSNEQPPQSETLSILVDLEIPTKDIPCSFSVSPN